MSEQVSQPSESDRFEVTDVDETLHDTETSASPRAESAGADDTSPESGSEPPSEPQPEVGGAPETGDLVIDASLRDLADAPADDLDAQIERGEQVQRTLQGRLSDLGG
ncbi:hypothetical protein V6K52_08980 [Knoellia sp. S7-12]|uniref:hypothetical protein n=1 Tax=Knoellia sp. S7-12 TaxID=3126698 RepID=UPI003366C790